MKASCLRLMPLHANVHQAAHRVHGVLLLVLFLGLPLQVTASSEWTTAQHLSQPRNFHTVTELNNGQFLIVGGDDSVSEPGATSVCELFDPATFTMTPTGSLNVPRNFHQAIRLADGRVLAVGGQAGGSGGAYLTSCEIYDPVAMTWTLAASMNALAANACLVMLENGNILKAGGSGSAGLGTTVCEIYNPTNNVWSYTGSLNVPRQPYDAWTVLDDGRVLVAGGYQFTSSVEAYDPQTETWSVLGSMGRAASAACVERLDDGRVLMMGGEYWSGTHTRYAAVDAYNPVTKSIAPAPSMLEAHAAFDTVKLPEGEVLVISGWSSNSEITPRCGLFLPDKNVWVSAPSLQYPRVNFTAVRSGSKVFVIGGYSKSSLEGPGLLPSNIEMLDTATLNPFPSTQLAINMYAGLTLQGPLGTRYRIEFNEDPADSLSWQTLTNFTLLANPTFFLDPDSATHDKRFYRAIVLP